MSLQVASLNSGSNGNCYYIGNRSEAVLIDAGISCRETEQRMKQLELSMQKVKAICITHDHSDHINGLHKIVKKYKISMYITSATRKNQSLEWTESSAVNFIAYEPVQVGDLTVVALPKLHDANDPHSFIVSHAGVTVGVFTDSGRVCEHLTKGFQLCHAAFLESNYDDEMLEKGGYPQHLKNRIRGGVGHLSNKEALQLFLKHRPLFMSHLFLSHLSKNNNKSEIVEDLFSTIAGNTQVIVAPRTSTTDVYQIVATNGAVNSSQLIQRKDQQLSLFELAK
ncbi:MAG: MBL fold metallo-hydrolase [Cyclobacteriaceae bacterium]|nr:MBL fold metallo-hydrolase [Cyclobacteriaceae bacterium]